MAESLLGHDQLICSSLEEKLQLCAELSALAGHGDSSPEPKLLVQPNTEELPNAAVLLHAALKEGLSSSSVCRNAVSLPMNILRIDDVIT